MNEFGRGEFFLIALGAWMGVLDKNNYYTHIDPTYQKWAEMFGCCDSLSLNQFPCVLDKNHKGDHERFDGRKWPEGQTWADVIEQFFIEQGVL